ncbi:PTS sugar transporter subunit IIC [Thermosediminibacter oceani]|uniref:Permease IIC component n=1 Tax=Thermosediminibacter oceani (strain ATCC BAA-1034 / DSM 16646 / JW/IW-1228P) TaxID=555079 RepID=D9S0V6_THEOJ|nr:PTS sugar transporter subunit IIC [Thermosediminibacter oceani]ADL07120.1 PTS system, lactose/cellobiose family IIC subunit [Thermosediminibacter oceani DSM 16646]
MEFFLKWVEEKLMPPMAKLAEQRHLRAVRDGIVATLPLIIVGSFFLIVASPPIPALAEKIQPYASQILIPFRLSVGLMALYAAHGIGYSLAKSYNLDPVAGGLLALASFIMITLPQNVEKIGFVLPMGGLGGAGLFAAIIMAFFAVEVLRFLTVRKITIKMPEGVPESVARSFEALIPAAAIMVIIYIVRVMLNINIQELIMNLFKPLVTAGDSLIGVLVPVILITLLWSAGIHGVSVVGSIARPIWMALLDENTQAAAAGAKILPHIAPEPFFQWFIWIGGSGATLSLVLLMLTSKSRYLKNLGKASLLPGVCNINEPVIFGAPIMLNPILAIPFIIGPVITAVISYIAMVFNLVGRPYVLAPWTLPAPIGAYLATGGDWRAVVLVLVNIALTTIIYYPFFKVYERKMMEEETES